LASAVEGGQAGSSVLGEALKGAKLGELWKYRVGDYRIIADIQDGMVCILIVRIGNRREVYRR
jgi:mRNA interferase RelE/StbE